MCRQRPCSHSESDHLEISPEQAPISPPTHRRPPWPGLCSLRSTCALSRSIEPALHSLISGYPDTHLHGSPLTPSVAHRHASDDPRGASSGLLLRAFTRRHASAQSTRTQHARLLSPSRRTGHGADASTRSALTAYRGPKTGSPAADPGSQRARATAKLRVTHAPTGSGPHRNNMRLRASLRSLRWLLASQREQNRVSSSVSCQPPSSRGKAEGLPAGPRWPA